VILVYGSRDRFSATSTELKPSLHDGDVTGGKAVFKVPSRGELQNPDQLLNSTHVHTKEHSKGIN
jgi:hypothetical protein